MKTLDAAEKNILNFIIAYKQDKVKSPSMRELADGTGLNSLSLDINLDSLSKKGYLYFSSNVYRPFQILKLPE